MLACCRLGTIDYLSPEILDCPVKAHPADHKEQPQAWYSNKVDCWSVGVLAYELLLGRTPFEAVSRCWARTCIADGASACKCARGMPIDIAGVHQHDAGALLPALHNDTQTNPL
jgi:serine/threonine protein kinase